MVQVKVPATTANLGPCFDTMGMALKGVYNYIILEEKEQGLEITVKGEGKDEIPEDESNIVYCAVKEVYKAANKQIKGLKLQLQNEIPVSRGMGSSAAAIVGGLKAANYILNFPLTEKELFDLAVKIEGHPDNVAPALLGQIVIVAQNEKDYIYRQINFPEGLKLVIAIPEYNVSTKEARNVLPEKYSREDAVKNVSSSTLLLWALINNDLKLFGEMIKEDKLHQNYRKSLVPGMEEVFDAALELGACGVSLSGAGPSIIAFCEDNQIKIAEAMKKAFEKNKINCTYVLSEPENEGAKVI